MSVPQIPPRPARSQQPQQNPIPDLNVPQVPPRPNRRTSERSQSPNRENFPRSPFNEPPGAPLTKTQSRGGGLYSNSQNASGQSMPERPPSVSLPSVGQEGSEYADIGDYSEDTATQEGATSGESPKETRNVAGDLPLHAPKPSVSDSTAKRRVSTVTRTDSSSAVAAGIGKASTPTQSADDVDPHDRNLKPKVSFRTGSSASTERPGSSSAPTEDEHGIPEIGQRVPMYPDAGDVQAPSPSPYQQQFPSGIGYHNSGIAKPPRQHRRTPSGRDALPPGSYGMHGHGVQSADPFEQDWYAKHPEALQKEEHGEYGPGIGGGRGEFALSSDDLNKLVRETSRSATNTAGLPNEQIGYKASEEYASRFNSPPHSATGTFKMAHSNSSQPHVESPLRKASFPVDPDAGQIIQKTRSLEPTSYRTNESALESETEDESTHISLPTTHKNKYTGNGYDPPVQDLGPHGGNTAAQGGYLEERGYGVPILASDEVAKTPGAEFMQPAVSPVQERRGSSYYTGVEGHGEYQSGLNSGSRPGSASNSRPTSRPGSIHSLPNLSRFSTYDEDRENMHTPLEDVDEYEPLFPDEEGNKSSKPMTPAQRVKMRETLKRFPSQDIWEDTPNSLQLQATVQTPEAEKEKSDPLAKTGTASFETAEQEATRKGEIPESEQAKLIPIEERLANSNFKPHIQHEMKRPQQQRFPSRDIWEDSPDSANLSTTVGETPSSPPDAGLEAGAVVNTSGSPRDGILAGEQPRDNATAGAPVMAAPSIPPRPSRNKPSPLGADGNSDTMPPPSIPARPPKRLHQVPPADAKVPIAPSKLAQDAKQISPTDARKPLLPERAKPQVPARPSKQGSHEVPDSAPLSKITSASSNGSDELGERDLTSPPGAPKVKPAIPARPAGSKIANLKAGFMGDLESRLKLGPQAPPKQKEPEPEEDKAPLESLTKGRARGPARRKPVPTAAATDASATDSKPKWEIAHPWTVWQTDESGAVGLGKGKRPHTPIVDAAVAAPAAAEAASKEASSPLEKTSDPTPSQEQETTDKSPSNDASEPTLAKSVESPLDADPKDMQQAKLAVEESIHATEPLSQASVTAPSTAGVPGAFPESEYNTLTKDAPSSAPQASSTIDTPAGSKGETHLGRKDTTVNPDITDKEKKAAMVGGEVQSAEDSFSRETHV